MGASGAGITMARVVTAVGTGQVGNVTETRIDDGNDRRLAHLKSLQRVVERPKWVAVKGYLGLASAEFVLLDACVALLNNSKEFLEQKCTDLEITKTTCRLQRTFMGNGKARSLFCSTLTRQPVINDVDNILQIFKNEGIQVTVLLCFTDVYNRMFHVAKRVPTGTTWDAFLRQEVIISTDVKNIDNTVVAD